MNAITTTTLPAIGSPIEGGFFAGLINLPDGLYGIAIAPKAEGQHKAAIWIPKYQDVPCAKSYYDGLANTKAMEAAGSKLAKWALGLDINGYQDWYIPAQDELELCYRYLKPGTAENWCYARSGINLSAEPATYPYTSDFPKQTEIALFQEGGAEAFDTDWYWTSTQYEGSSDFAWYQCFGRGGQGLYYKGSKLLARAVRRFKL